MKFKSAESRHGKKLEVEAFEVTYSMPFEVAYEMRDELEILIKDHEASIATKQASMQSMSVISDEALSNEALSNEALSNEALSNES